jgi:putative YphP/YqiW family bacilliredoxin
MYPEELIAPMRNDLTQVGFKELRTAEAVNVAVKNNPGTTLVMINSVCGCAAANARPAVKMAIQNSKKPDLITTAFAGNDVDAVNQARAMMAPYPPSSPSIALFKNGELVHMIERHHIEGRPAQMIAENLINAFEEYC